jgi:Type IV secretory system Conjugative DNA transfer
MGELVAATPSAGAGPAAGRIILGRRDRIRDRLLGRLYLAVEQCHSVLAFGPPGSFKTHGLVIPAILEWQGNLVTTSIKPDVLRATCAHRASLGAVWVYDPLGLSGVPGARWTPLAYCQTYSDARRIGRMLAEAADVQGHKADDASVLSAVRPCLGRPPWFRVAAAARRRSALSPAGFAVGAGRRVAALAMPMVAGRGRLLLPAGPGAAW